MSGADQYLLAVYIAGQRDGSPVSSGHVADLLDRSAASATEMLQQLETRGLVTYEPYEGATLTAEGRERAERLHESYVTLSWFFRSVLDLDSHEAEAMEMAGVIDPSVVDRLAATLPSEGT
ncbi:metal-dependent transcriptional regulator [Halostella salina]|uniref:metal-dependent transcriptional regulator n=1 Tax=Halostella salina TaxID=1547897 RepID=UPI000EF7CF8B|nr:metal-dependent transcriptional regulator [Halostella salina]